MAIEFRCSRCQRLLRSSDESAGKQTVCPECGSTLSIPAPRPPLEAARARPGEPAGSPFATIAQGIEEPGAAANPYESPLHGGPTPNPVSPGGAGGQLEIGDLLGCAWHIFSTKFVECLLATLLLLMGGLLTVFAVVLIVALGALMYGLMSEAGHEPLGVAAWVLTGVVGFAVLLAGQSWIYAGMASWTLKLCRGENPQLGELFAGGRHFGVMFRYTLIVLPCVLLGYLLCVAPGFLVGLLLSQGMYLIVDRNLGAVEACRRSKDLAMPQLIPLLLLLLISMAILTVASFVPMGGLVAQPFVMVLSCVAYLRLTGQFVLTPPAR